MVTGPEHASGDQPAAPRGPERSVEDVIRTAVGMVAPDELPYFDALSSAYFDDPDRALRPGARRGSILDIGIPGAEGMITTVLLGAASGLLTVAAQQAASQARRRGLRRWRARQRKAARQAALASPVPATEAPARAAADRVARIAIDVHIDGDKADRIGLAMFVALTADPDDRRPAP